MKKKFCIAGIVVSVLVVLLGILTITGSLGGETGYASESYYYDSGYASFGADFYTYVSNNAQEAASASRTTAANLNAISKLLKNAIGFGFIAIGLLCCCAFGVAMSGCVEPKSLNAEKQQEDNTAPAEAENPAPPEAATAEPVETVPAPAEEQENEAVSNEEDSPVTEDTAAKE